MAKPIMKSSQKIKLTIGVLLVVISPFIGIVIAPLFHPLTCQPDVPGKLQLFQCLQGDFSIWILTLALVFITGVLVITSSLHKIKSKGRRKKQTPLFIIPWTEKAKLEVTKRGIIYTVGVSFIVFVLVLMGLVTNVIPFGYATVRCGHLPVESSRFMADFSYKLPGDIGYGVNMFSEYRFCTEADIKSTGGYHRNVFTEAARLEAEALRAAREEAAKFSPSKIDYQVYVPKLEGFTVGDFVLRDMSSGDTQTFFSLRKDNSTVGFSFREGKIPNDYQLCRHEKYTCEVIGKDKDGNIVQKQTSGRESNPIVYYGVNRGDTFINIGQGRDVNYSDEAMIGIINTLEVYRE